MKTTSKIKATKKNEQDLKNDDDLKIEGDLKKTFAPPTLKNILPEFFFNDFSTWQPHHN